MSIQIEALFTNALGLQAPWQVTQVELNTAKRRIDFKIAYSGKHGTCPSCQAGDQAIHDRIERSWRHLDFFQFEAWLHAQVPRIQCSHCGKTAQIPVPWAREGSGFTLLFEALSLSLCQELPVSQAARQLRVQSKRLWRQLHHYVQIARAQDDMSEVVQIGVDETSAKRGHDYITVVHDLPAKRLLFACQGKDHQTLQAFVQDLRAHGGDPEQIQHVCVDMSAAYTKGITESLPNAQISYDRFHVIALANDAMEEVRLEEMRTSGQEMRAVMGAEGKHVITQLRWSMRKNPEQWSVKQINMMYRLQRANFKSARAWRLKQALRRVYQQAAASNSQEIAREGLTKWISWARRCRLEPFKQLASTLKERLEGVIHGMLDGRSNAYVEAMNGMIQQAKTAARGFRNTANLIAVAYLRMSKLKHLPPNPFAPASPRHYGCYQHFCR